MTIYDRCARNVLTLTTANIHSDVTHTMLAAGGPLPLTPSSTAVPQLVYTSSFGTADGCTFNLGLDIFDGATETWLTYATEYAANNLAYPWIDNASIGADYSFNIVTDDYATYDNENIDPTIFAVRLWVEDPDSVTTSGKIYDYFGITLRYECDDDVKCYYYGCYSLVLF